MATAKRERETKRKKNAHATSKIVPLHPVDHVAAVTRPNGHGVLHVDTGNVVFNIFHTLHEIVVGPTTPTVIDSYRLRKQ